VLVWSSRPGGGLPRADLVASGSHPRAYLVAGGGPPPTDLAAWQRVGALKDLAAIGGEFPCGGCSGLPHGGSSMGAAASSPMAAVARALRWWSYLRAPGGGAVARRRW
jgi:hypothetical protein